MSVTPLFRFIPSCCFWMQERVFCELLLILINIKSSWVPHAWCSPAPWLLPCRMFISSAQHLQPPGLPGCFSLNGFITCTNYTKILCWFCQLLLNCEALARCWPFCSRIQCYVQAPSFKVCVCVCVCVCLSDWPVECHLRLLLISSAINSFLN